MELNENENNNNNNKNVPKSARSSVEVLSTYTK
jgi:hypothetical protein